MEYYQVTTLVDITLYPTGYNATCLSINQLSNFNSLVQAIGLRSNLDWDKNPIFYTGSLPYPIQGKANHWIWEFWVEREMVFYKDNDYCYYLLEDINGVPIIPNLNDSIDLYPAAYCTKGSKINTWISKIQ